MRKMRELIIGYGPDHFPIAAVCFACGASMPRPDPALTLTEDVIAGFESAFAAHKKRKHGSGSDREEENGTGPLQKG